MFGCVCELCALFLVGLISLRVLVGYVWFSFEFHGVGFGSRCVSTEAQVSSDASARISRKFSLMVG